MSFRVVLTKKEADKVINSQKPGQIELFLSLDLGKTKEKVIVEGQTVLVRGLKILIKEFEKVKENTIYAIEEGKLLAIELFSNETNLYYKLKPTNDWPTLMLSSVPMHRFKQISPKTSAELMVKEISPIQGKILDTCGGLGYTAILSSKKAEGVVVFERDENVLQIAKYNPYSEELFINPKINLKREDVFEGVRSLESNSFDRVLHDPPTVSFAKDLYTTEFYKELFRVMKSRAVLYHYCPNPGKTKGKVFYPTIIKLLTKAGFSNCVYHKSSSGVRSIKK